MKYVYNDGGRSAAGYKGTTGDCVCRAISIATELPYKEVYNLINEFAKKERITKHNKTRSSARTGVSKPTIKKIMEYLGWTWVPCMSIGTGCQTHLDENELPTGRIICSCSKHLVAVIDGVLNDTYDSSRDGSRCVYGYYIKKT